MKYTAIWVDSWMSRSQRHSLTKAFRFEVNEEAGIKPKLKAEGIWDQVVYLFEGWPKLDGEEDEDVCPGHV